MVFRRRRMVAPINSIKHYVHRTNSGVGTGAIQTNIVADAVVAPATANAFSVHEGAIIKAVFIEFWVVNTGSTGNDTQFIMIIEKSPGGNAVMTAAEATNLGAYDNKKNILYVTQGNLTAEVDGGIAVPLFRNWIMIPKGKQRFGLGDRLFVHFEPVGQTCNVCGIFTYKEYN